MFRLVYCMQLGFKEDAQHVFMPTNRPLGTQYCLNQTNFSLWIGSNSPWKTICATLKRRDLVYLAVALVLCVSIQSRCERVPGLDQM